ncbi:DUF4276 family protein [Ideonella sp. B508-1]|uniref:DUF4276 family protein n=1 Tax=Ideonella sp. B508-1 TaxID=137716 RepID=UPI00034D2181|nr:DUF4276 family protein [Ideonella sp. B508-1]
MKELVFLLEEASAEALLKSLLPRFLPAGLMIRFQVFEGKQDLERHIAKRLRSWQNPGARFIVLRDQDSEPDCQALKARLIDRCQASDKGDRAMVRIACRELEAFYLADLAAVERALGIGGLAAKQAGAKYRTPDRLESPSRELRQLTRHRYQKVAGSRALGAELDVANERSKSFKNLMAAVRRQVELLDAEGSDGQFGSV